MDREKYARDMKKIGAKSLNYLNTYLKRKIKDKELFDTVTLFLKKRKEAIARPWIIKNSWSYFSQQTVKDIKKCLPLASVAELESISNYQSNAVYDNKYIIYNEKDKVLQLLASFITRDIVDEVLFEEYKIKLAVLLSKVLRKIDLYDQLGQHKEFNKLYYDKKLNFENLEEYIQNYLKKAMYFGGAWVGGLILAGAILAFDKLPKNNKDLKCLIKFGILSGTAMNIINDISDYALFEKQKSKFGMHYKKSGDQFKDIENKRILLPFYYAFYQAKRKNKKDFLKLEKFIGIELSLKQKKEVFNLIKKYNGLSYAYTIARLINNRALRELKKVKNKDRIEIKFFKVLSSMVENNKFLHYYRSQDALKRITLNPKIKKLIQSKFFYRGGVAIGMASGFFEV